MLFRVEHIKKFQFHCQGRNDGQRDKQICKEINRLTGFHLKSVKNSNSWNFHRCLRLFLNYFGIEHESKLLNHPLSDILFVWIRWLEPRIEGPAPDPENPYVAVDIKFINELWVPDIYVYFLKQINVLTVFTKFAGSKFVKGLCRGVEVCLYFLNQVSVFLIVLSPKLHLHNVESPFCYEVFSFCISKSISNFSSSI